MKRLLALILCLTVCSLLPAYAEEDVSFVDIRHKTDGSKDAQYEWEAATATPPPPLTATPFVSPTPEPPQETIAPPEEAPDMPDETPDMPEEATETETTPRPTQDPYNGAPVPELIKSAVEYALSEWEKNGGEPIDRYNKYTRWYSSGKDGFGWCGAFVGYCLDQVGVPMEHWEDCVELMDGEPHAVREAGVGKLLKGYTALGRLSTSPQPGYLVIYGVRASANTTVHVGMVTSVTEMGDGYYMVQTVEGNVSNTIKRYCYVYDEYSDDAEFNMYILPEEDWIDGSFQYELHTDNWYVNIFCQTWL